MSVITINEFVQILLNHDFWYAYSDSRGTYDSGEKETKKIIELCNENKLFAKVYGAYNTITLKNSELFLEMQKGTYKNKAKRHYTKRVDVFLKATAELPEDVIKLLDPLNPLVVKEDNESYVDLFMNITEKEMTMLDNLRNHVLEFETITKKWKLDQLLKRGESKRTVVEKQGIPKLRYVDIDMLTLPVQLKNVLDKIKEILHYFENKNWLEDITNFYYCDNREWIGYVVDANLTLSYNEGKAYFLANSFCIKLK